MCWWYSSEGGKEYSIDIRDYITGIIGNFNTQSYEVTLWNGGEHTFAAQRRNCSENRALQCSSVELILVNENFLKLKMGNIGMA